MNIERVRPMANPSKTDLLPFFDTTVRMLQALRSAAANNGTRDVTEVTGRLGAGKNIHDDRRVRANGTATLIVRIDALICGSNDGMARHITKRHDRRVDDSPQNLRRQASSIQVQVAILTNLCPSNRIDSGFDPHFRRAQRIGDKSDFLGPF